MQVLGSAYYSKQHSQHIVIYPMEYNVMLSGIITTITDSADTAIQQNNSSSFKLLDFLHSMPGRKVPCDCINGKRVD